MSLIVEDGSGLSTAESYISVADATARHAALGNDTWATITTTEMEQALRRATLYMLQTYRNVWVGNRLTSTQALDWPRYGVAIDGFALASNVIPAEVGHACADLALKAAAADLSPDIKAGGGVVNRVKAGSVEVAFQVDGTTTKTYRAIDGLLGPLLGFRSRYSGASARA
jgi:hypothetical protein